MRATGKRLLQTLAMALVAGETLQPSPPAPTIDPSLYKIKPTRAHNKDKSIAAFRRLGRG